MNRPKLMEPGKWSAEFDGNGHCVSAVFDASFRRLLGYGSGEDSADGIGMWRNSIHPDDLERVTAYLADTASKHPDGMDLDIEYRMKTPGGYRWFHDYALCSRRADGSLSRCEGVVFDIQEGFDKVETIRHEQLRRDVFAYMADHGNDPAELLNTFAERLRVLIDCDQILYRDIEDTRVMINSPAIENTWCVPEEYCRHCEHFDPNHPMYRDGYTEMSNCQEGWQGIPVYHECPIKSSLTRIVYCDGEVAGYIAFHYIQKYHEFTDTERSTLEEFARILSVSLSGFRARKNAAELSSVMKNLSMSFALSDQYDPIAVIDPETGEYDWLMSVAADVVNNTSMTRHGEDIYRSFEADCDSLLHEEDREGFRAFYSRENFLEIAATGNVRETEGRWFIRTEGRYRWKYGKAVRMIGDNGKAYVVIGVADTTEEKERESEELVRKQLFEEQQALAENSARFFALEDTFQSLYDVELESGLYVSFDRDEFYTKNVSDRLVSATEFFTDLRENVENIVYEEDREAVYSIQTRENIIRELAEKDHIDHYYRIITENGPLWLKMRIVYKDSDRKNVIVGIFSAEEEMKTREMDESFRKALIENNARLFALEDDFESLYDVELDSGHYDVFVKGDFYRNTVLDKLPVPGDYFEELRSSIDSVIYRDDRDGLYEALTRESIRAELSENEHFDYYYRISTDNGPVWFKMRVVYKNADRKNVIIGVFNAENDIQAQQIAEQKDLLEKNMQLIGGLASGYDALYYINIDEGTYKTYSLSEEKYPESYWYNENVTDIFGLIRAYGHSSHVHPEDRYLFDDFDGASIREKLNGKKQFSIQFRMESDNGYRWNVMDVIKYGEADVTASVVAVGFSDHDEDIRSEQAINSAFEVLGLELPEGQSIDRILSIAGDFYGAERCYVFEYFDNTGLINNTYEWCADGIEPMIGRLQNVPIDAVEGWNNEFRRQGAFYMDALDSEHNTEETRAILEMQGIESLVAAPVMNGDRIVGFIGVDNPTKAKTDISILEKASAVVFSEILKRDENGEEHVTLGKLTDAFLSVYFVDLATDYMRTWKIDERYKDAYGAVRYYSVSMGGYVSSGIIEKDRERCAMMTSPEYVLGQFRTADRFSIDTTDILLGYERSIVFDYIKVNDEGSRFVLCCRDVTEVLAREKEQKNKIEEALVFTNFFLGTYLSAYYVDLNTRSCQIYKQTENIRREYGSVTDYLESLTDYVERYVHPADRSAMLEAVRPENIRVALKENSEYSHVYRDIMGGNEKICRMQVIRGTEEGRAAFGFSDITKEVNEQRVRQMEAEESQKLIDSIAASYNIAYAVNMSTDSFRLLRMDDFIIGSDRKFGNFTEAKEFFMSILPEPDRSRMSGELDYDTIRSRLRDTKSYDIEYRVPINGAMIWHIMNVTEIDGDYIAIGFAMRDLELTQKHLEHKRYSEYFALYEIDIDSGMMKIVKDSPYYGIDRVGTAIPYIPAMLKFASGLDDEPREFFEKLADLDYIRQLYATEDKRTYAYRSNNVGEKNWVDCTSYVTLRHPDGSPAMFTFGFSLLDSLGVYRQELQKKYVEQNAVLVSQQEQLEIARELADAASQAKSNFLFNMSHDIRTPMNAIRGFTTMARKHAGDEQKVTEYLNKIDISGQQLLTLINQVLEMARIESGKIELEENQVNVPEEFNTMVTVLSEQAKVKGLRFSYSIENLEHRYVFADEARVGSIALNIAGNSMKYTPEGGSIEFRLRETEPRRPGYATMVMTISDTGIGMSREYLKEIYEPFSRERNSTVSKIQGTGLGLSIVKNTVDLMGGNIEVESELGRGTRFDITLDFRIDGNAVSESCEKEETGVISFEGRRVLLVEDNEMNREIARDILEEQGLEVEDTEDGDVAVGKIRDIIGRGEYGYYDFILMDVQMPRMNGYDAARAIRAIPEPEGVHIPIIAMTANAFEEDRQNALAAGMDDHLAKPIDIQTLFMTLAKYL